MTGLNRTASAKLAVIWIIDPKVLLHSEPNIALNLPYFFMENFVQLELFFFKLDLFKPFYRRINKPYMHTNIICIFSFQNGLNT